MGNTKFKPTVTVQGDGVTTTMELFKVPRPGTLITMIERLRTVGDLKEGDAFKLLDDDGNETGPFIGVYRVTVWNACPGCIHIATDTRGYKREYAPGKFMDAIEYRDEICLPALRLVHLY